MSIGNKLGRERICTENFVPSITRTVVYATILDDVKQESDLFGSIGDISKIKSVKLRFCYCFK